MEQFPLFWGVGSAKSLGAKAEQTDTGWHQIYRTGGASEDARNQSLEHFVGVIIFGWTFQKFKERSKWGLMTVL